MRNPKTIAWGLVAALAVAGAVYAQQKGGKAGKLTTADYVEIQQLYSRFSWALSSGFDNGKAYANTFTVDGTFVHSGTVKIVGREALAKLAMSNKSADAAPGLRFVNILIAPSPEGARGGAYLIGANTGGSTHSDILVKTREGWRFKYKEFIAGKLPPPEIQALLLQ